MCGKMRIVEPAAGRLLLATPLLREAVFDRAVILLLDHGSEGSAGVVLNRPLEIQATEIGLESLGEVASPAVLFEGGPVETMGLVGVTTDEDGRVVPRDLDSTESTSPVRVYLGYSGWSAGQLVEELEEGAWWVVDCGPDDAFTTDPLDLWFEVVGRFEDRRSWLKLMPSDPAHN